MSNILELSLMNSSDKYYIIKQFIIATTDYIQIKGEDSANGINRHLELINEAADLSIFDPHVNLVVEFFVCLHELLSNLEPGSFLVWPCIDVLTLACKNLSARMVLIQTYQFMPLLSRSLSNQLPKEKKLKILGLMQELSCGIKISWQIPYLIHIMSTLTHWIENSDQDIQALSLAVLVNLCYKNVPAVYTLSRCIDIKKFIRFCLPLKGLKVEVHVCKLLIILDYMNGKVPEDVVLKSIEVTFKSLIEAFRAKDYILLRHVAEFCLDMWDNNCHSRTLLNFNGYDGDVESLLVELEGRHEDARNNNVSQCVAVVFQFLHFVMQKRRPNIKLLDKRLVNLALKWVQVNHVCSNAYEILRTLAANVTEETSITLDPLLTSLPIYLLDIVNGEEEVNTNIETNRRLKSLLELLRSLIRTDSTRERVLAILKEDLFIKIFVPLLNKSPTKTRAHYTSTQTLDAVLLYASAIVLISELCKYDGMWRSFFADLMQQRQIHMVLAQALYNGTKETKTLIMSISSCEHFPINRVSEAMCELQPAMQLETTKSVSNPISDNFNFPMMSVTQSEKLNDLMAKIKEAYNQSLLSISMADIMELYEYKIASMNQAERAGTASIEAATMHCTHLQHRVAQLTAEVSKLRQLGLHSQQCNEEMAKTKEAVLAEKAKLQELLDAEKSRYASQLSAKEKVLKDTMQLLEDTSKRLKVVETEKGALEEKQTNLKQIVAKLEDNILKKEALVQKNEEIILRTNANVDHLNLQVSQLEKQVKRGENELASKTRELSEVSKELHNCKSILGTITQLTNSQYGKHAGGAM
ncbi:hypothetical protein PPYR_12924 [Photinus pyralis]|uniref:CIP2A N-terminal domain-containing protein n=2 Tax=Photinus pyralis TaxID=7054 RepID=A0A5N4A7K0_PHOPY|nr:protein CIP2A-like [Photinus pyralis]KAB0793304.1 hypothetical protein PPYR_12924 [Photinus pyralis]